MADQSQMLSVASRLWRSGAHLGATQVLFNAALAAQREAAQGRDLSQWTPGGPIPLGRKPAEQPHPANDHLNASSSDLA